MFFLGDYYAKKGVKQNLSEAKKYYEEAAQNGSDEMKLKVAKAFDIPSDGTEPALSLDRAEYWYYKGGCEEGHRVSNLYFYDNDLYYVYSREYLN